MRMAMKKQQDYMCWLTEHGGSYDITIIKPEPTRYTGAIGSPEWFQTAMLVSKDLCSIRSLEISQRYDALTKINQRKTNKGK